MRSSIRFLMMAVTATTALCLGGCASPTSIVKTYRTPTPPPEPVKKVVVIGVDDRALVREGFENRFVRILRSQKQEAMISYDVLSLAEINRDKKEAKEKMLAAGADAVLIIQLTDRMTNDRQVGPRPVIDIENLLSGASDMGGWELYYSDTYVKMGTSWGRDSATIYLNSGLHDLKTGRLIWATVTKTVVKDNADRLVLTEGMVTMVVEAMHKDGMVR